MDPELEAFLKEAGEHNHRKPLKVTMRLQYLHNFTDLSAQAMEMIQILMKPVKVIIMDVSIYIILNMHKSIKYYLLE